MNIKKDSGLFIERSIVLLNLDTSYFFTSVINNSKPRFFQRKEIYWPINCKTTMY